MRFALVTLGSAGDLHPFLGLGRALVEAGHEAVLLSHAPYEDEARACGLEFRAVVSSELHERALRHPKLWHPIDGLGVLWRHLCIPSAPPTQAVLQALAHDCMAQTGHPLRVLASPLAIGARWARETTPMRLTSVYLSPAALRHTEDPFCLGPWQWPRRVPQWVRRWAWKALDRWKLEPLARPWLNARYHAGQRPPPSGSVFGDWIHSPDGGIALFDASFAEVPPPWRHRVVQAGFIRYERHAPSPLPSGVEHFLRQGARPWLLFGGSAATHGPAFDRLVEQLQAEVRVVLIDGNRAAPEIQGDGRTLRTPPLSLAALLPHCAGVVHHGGIGTCAQALAAQLPQVMIATAYDQVENAARLHAMGRAEVYRTLPDPPTLLSTLRRLTSQKAPERPPEELALHHSWPGHPNAAARRAVELLSRMD